MRASRKYVACVFAKEKSLWLSFRAPPWSMRACVCVFMREFLRENTRELCEREKRVVRGNSR